MPRGPATTYLSGGPFKIFIFKESNRHSQTIQPIFKPAICQSKHFQSANYHPIINYRQKKNSRACVNGGTQHPWSSFLCNYSSESVETRFFCIFVIHFIIASKHSIFFFFSLFLLFFNFFSSYHLVFLMSSCLYSFILYVICSLCFFCFCIALFFKKFLYLFLFGFTFLDPLIFLFLLFYVFFPLLFLQHLFVNFANSFQTFDKIFSRIFVFFLFLIIFVFFFSLFVTFKRW